MPPPPPPSPTSPLPPPPRRRRRRLRHPRTTVAGAAPETPAPRWHDGNAACAGDAGSSAGDGAAAVSARRLAAELWRRRRPVSRKQKGVSIAGGNVRRGLLTHDAGALNHRVQMSHEAESFVGTPRSQLEDATKWDQQSSKASDGRNQAFDKLSCVGRSPARAGIDISALHEELHDAKTRIGELEAERRASKKKVDQFLRNLAEEKALWRSSEHEKAHGLIDAVKEDLMRERKNRQRMEVIHSKLVSELQEARTAAKRHLQDYEKEKKARELMEEVCDELAKQIAEDKAEVEALKAESAKMQEELEREREMLQMAEVWREERVQMKLTDAKLTLDYKYSQLNKLQDDLEAFLTKENCRDLNSRIRREAEKLVEAIASVRIHHDAEIFCYDPPPASEDIYAIFEELKEREGCNEREIESYEEQSPVSPRIRTVSPTTDRFLAKPSKRNKQEDVEDDSGWETASHVEEQGSCNSLEGSERSVNGFCRSGNVTNRDENGKAHSGLTEARTSSTAAKKCRKKGGPFARLWRESKKAASWEVSNGSRVSNGQIL